MGQKTDVAALIRCCGHLDSKVLLRDRRGSDSTRAGAASDFGRQLAGRGGTWSLLVTEVDSDGWIGIEGGF